MIIGSCPFLFQLIMRFMFHGYESATYSLQTVPFKWDLRLAPQPVVSITRRMRFEKSKFVAPYVLDGLVAIMDCSRSHAEGCMRI